MLSSSPPLPGLFWPLQREAGPDNGQFREVATAPAKVNGSRPGRIRVCLVVDQVTHNAGTERQVSETVRRMDHSRFEVHLCCFEDSPKFRDLGKVCHAELFPLESVKSWQGARQVRRFHQYLRRHRIEIVQTFMNKSSTFAAAARFRWKGILITSRLNMGYWYTPKKIWLFRALNLVTDRVVANSEGAKRIAMKVEGLPDEKVDVVYQGVDMEAFSERQSNPEACRLLGIPPNARVVTQVANLRPVKDPELFLRGAALAASQVPDVVFLMAGKGEMKAQLVRLATDRGIGERVFFTDGHGNIPDYLGRSSIGSLTSHSEGFSNAILEYMAMGLPVVATDVGGNREAILDGETGLLLKDREPETLAAALVRLLTDEPLRAAMGRRARERCASEFEINLTIRRLEDYFESLARPSNGQESPNGRLR